MDMDVWTWMYGHGCMDMDVMYSELHCYGCRRVEAYAESAPDQL